MKFIGVVSPSDKPLTPLYVNLTKFNKKEDNLKLIITSYWY